MARVQLDSGVPVANGVLTVDDEFQAEARMSDKGADVARAADRDGQPAPATR